MNSDLLHLAAFLGYAICIFFGGAFICALLWAKLLQKKNWTASIGIAFLWMILFALFSTVVSDICVAGLRSHPQWTIAITLFVFSMPYIGIIFVLLTYKKAQQDAAANP